MNNTEKTIEEYLLALMKDRKAFEDSCKMEDYYGMMSNCVDIMYRSYKVDKDIEDIHKQLVEWSGK